MRKRMLLIVMVLAGCSWLAAVATASPLPPPAPASMATPASMAAPAPMCSPEGPELVQPPAADCTPRGGDCRYDHDCCSSICRTIKGVKSCS